ncbi:cytochrome-c oxidase, cbb3-type subunit III [Sphingobium nicotianae]|uniref:Cbb3-type cytochrome c oxidase subunit n=1 Tax=Sphingobium nicotianae TaxID=2782607 RepID=A0A9X1IR69_9SPHN|nr:cytochrome-c oxidase, cbb3-type subunit III [Sphingobium nicotianae]MBT2187186.1 cytochrome-c oxidase, cbb3-type subunit III [Sphingobium nicotianae]
MAVRERDPHSGHMTTGHDWDGIKELNTPVPRAVWFFLSLAALFSVGYWILMPAWPLGRTYTKGLLGIDQKSQVAKHLDVSATQKANWASRIAKLDVPQIRADAALMAVVREDGHRLFGDNCAACHGMKATGGNGFPNLVDADWLWGGDPQTVAHTIEVGVNSGMEGSRVNQMLAFGRDGILDNDAILAVTAYVQSLSVPSSAKGQAAQVNAGRAIFAANCEVCHGPTGRGNQAIGVPNLTDTHWIYGGDAPSIYTSIYGGRQGVMPAWGQRLSAVDRKILTAYVLDLGTKQ